MTCWASNIRRVDFQPAKARAAAQEAVQHLNRFLQEGNLESYQDAIATLTHPETEVPPGVDDFREAFELFPEADKIVFGIEP